VGGIVFFRRHERELELRAQLALPGRWYDGFERKSG
jgi:hypothetical protein